MVKNENKYYFTGAEYAIENIQKQRLKLSLATKVNDCHEFVGVNFPNKHIEKAFIEHRNTIEKTNGFICMSKSWTNPLMWGHYSDNGKGICLGFKLEMDKSFINSIEYSTDYSKKELPEYFINYLVKGDGDSKKVKKFLTETLCFKSIDWKYENEVKIFHELKEAKYKLINGSFIYFTPFEEDYILNEVIIGTESNIKPIDINLVLKDINYEYEVTIFKATPHLKSFMMDRDAQSVIIYKPSKD